MVKVPNNKVKLFFLLHEEMVEERPFRAAKSVLKKWALALSPACNGRNKKARMSCGASFFSPALKRIFLAYSRGPEGPLFHRFFTLKRKEKMFRGKVLGCNLDNVA
ncbi:MAG TPA: hypothetical protein VGN44_14455 [Candidatus Angelobacter sp.]